MNIITPSIKIINQGSGLQGIYEQIELAGRTCYQSTHSIQYQENEECTGQVSITAKPFVDRLIKSGHTSVLEHGTVYLKVPNEIVNKGFQFETDWDTLCFDPYTRYSTDCYYYYYTTNYRVIIEHNLQEVLKYLCEPTEFHEKRVTVVFNTDIGVSRESNRHRVNSISESSTRYCNYSKNKFGNQITIAANADFSKEEIEKALDSWSYHNSASNYLDPFYNMCNHIASDFEDGFEAIDYWIFANSTCEWAYMNLINKCHWKPEQARRILPLDLHTELVHTAFVSDWKRFCDMRSLETTGKTHPDMHLVADPLRKELIKRNYI